MIDMCSVCAGTGKPVSNIPCICGGKGTLTAEMDGLREAINTLRRTGHHLAMMVLQSELYLEPGIKELVDDLIDKKLLVS